MSQYGVFEFTGSGDPLASPRPGAYYYLALIVHLTEDMGVPAHAYNILHSQSSDDLDNMEQVAFSSYREANPLIIIPDTGKDLLQCYRLSREHTLSLTSPPYWRLYYNNDGTCGIALWYTGRALLGILRRSGYFPCKVGRYQPCRAAGDLFTPWSFGGVCRWRISGSIQIPAATGQGFGYWTWF